jgi:aquaporin Z
MQKYVTELIGTFFLVLTVGCTVIDGGAHIIPALAIGSALMIMVFAGGHISGGHYNPAVTLGAYLRGGFEGKDVLPYWLAQGIGAGMAALAVKAIHVSPIHTTTSLPVGPALMAEFLFTFALVYVVLNVATSKDSAGNSYYGLAIGFTVMAGVMAVGGISGGAFNPAVALGISAIGLVSWGNIWIFLAAEILAAAAAAGAYRFITGEMPVFRLRTEKRRPAPSAQHSH